MLNKKQKVGLGLLFGWIFFILYVTLLCRIGTYTDMGLHLKPFWSYMACDVEPGLLPQIIGNITMFIPFGVLIGVYLYRDWKHYTVSVLCVLCFVVAIELLQFNLHLGWFDIDDIINAMLGTALGIGGVLWSEYVRGEE